MEKETALNVLKELHGKSLYSERTALETFIPELKESEDEKIRKKLKHYLEVKRCQTNDDDEYINCNNFLAWLEKQGEHKKFRDSIQVGDEVTRNSDGVIVNMSQLKRVAKPAQQKLPIEKLPEEMKTIEESLGFTTQKECDEYNQMVSGLIMSDEEDYNNIDPHFGKLINKVEPKFKVGDWCIDDEDGTIFQIVKVLNNTYTYKTNEGKEYSCTHYSLENDAHLWTIQDAKDGDVLACNEEILLFKSYSVQGRISLYCWYNGQTNNFHSKEVVDTLMTTRNKIYPATKEQRDILFSKMKEAGYTFDFEKKELKKVEKKSQRMISAEAKEAMYDKPTDEDVKEALRTEYEKGRADAFAQMQKEWSEEDEEQVSIITNIVKAHCGKLIDCRSNLSWLKSLKDRVQPKQEWSEEDEKMFNFCCEYLDDTQEDWLKSIKQRIGE